MMRRKNADDSHGEHYLAQTVKLYGAVAAYNAQLCPDGTMEVANVTCRERGLLPTLRTYQRRAVCWMLGRENAPGWGDSRRSPLESYISDGDGSGRSGTADRASSHSYRLYDFAASFQRLEDVNGVGFYVHTASGTLSGTLPNAVDLPLGGVLADEMGLGKTLEVLGCILLHPRPSLPAKASPFKMASDGTEAIVDAPAADVCARSAVDGIPATLSASPLEQQNFLECSCSPQDGSSDDKERVQCAGCGVIQHAKCMEYDLAVHKEPYLCPYCLLEEPIQSKTTLIVVPESIAHQWLSEIERHVRPGTLKFAMYAGASSQKYTQPLSLCSFDIIITTYEVLSRELRFTNLRRTTGLVERRLGKPRRFTAMPSPLKAVQWWRICLDEAQMVESVTTKTATMALMLHAVNRWCVTGTPVQHSLQDLYGLMLFLGVKPFYIKQLWQQLLYEPHEQGISEELCDIVSRIMWRSSKTDVANELNLPPVTYNYNYVNLTPVEDFFYRYVRRNCRRGFKAATRTISDLRVQPNGLEKGAHERVMEPLRQLLHACCHPQAVRNFFMYGQETTLPMEEVARKLVKNTVTECEELHRLTVSHHLGLAGLYILSDKLAEAVKTYRGVLKSAEDHLTKEVRTDDLQLLHTVYNLRNLLQGTAFDAAPNVPSTSASAAACGASTIFSHEEQQKLLQKEHEIRNRYGQNSKDAVRRSREEWRNANERVVQLTQELSACAKWWEAMIDTCREFGCHAELVDEVHYALLQCTAHIPLYTGMKERIDGVRQMKLVLKSALKEHREAYCAVTDKLALIDALEPGTPEFGDLMQASIRCCLRPKGAPLKSCHFCVASEILAKYETKVFLDTFSGDYGARNSHNSIENNARDESEAGVSRQVAWKPSECEVLLTALVSFCQKRNSRVLLALDGIVLEAGQNHLNLFKAWRAEFKPLRALWVALYERARTLDELEMATERIQLRCDPSDQTTHSFRQKESMATNVVASQVPVMIDTTAIDLRKDEERLRKSMRHLQYLRNCAEDSKKKLEPCPICMSELSDDGWTVLTCGHYLCYGCMLTTCEMVARNAWGERYRDVPAPAPRNILCPLCRAATPISLLTIVRPTSNMSNQGSSEPHSDDVRGDLSSKMKAIVRCVKEIVNKDRTAKIIVMSEIQILWRVEDALHTNNIELVYVLGRQGANVKEKLFETFKTGSATVLLLPIAYGSAGLNLVEATHIIFPSPILNPAQEFQAIGRIHRIGQTRPTHVHYFIMKDTIEDKLHAAVRKSVERSASDYNFAATDDIPLTLQEIAQIFDPSD